jgi:hypothetical protein
MEEMGRSGWKPNAIQLKAYGCRAYPYDYSRAKGDKLSPRAHIGYLVGYEASNIWRIWIPSIHRVISTRDVTFDESRRYSIADEAALEAEVVEIVKLIELPSLNSSVEEEFTLEDYEYSIDESGDTIAVGDSEIPSDVLPSTIQIRKRNRPRHRPAKPLEKEPQLLSPEPTPEPEVGDQHRQLSSPPDDTTLIQSGGTGGIPPGENALQPTALAEGATRRRQARMLDLGIDMNQQQPESSTRRKPPRRAVNSAFRAMTDDLVDNPNSLRPYLTVFHVGVTPEKRIHRDDAPPEPNGWKQMLKHVYRLEFTEGARKEYDTLDRQEVWYFVTEDQLNGIKPIPLRWVFKYKVDDFGYIVKYKARLCVRGDLQENKLDDTYAATLAARIFRALMAIAAYFDLDIEQLDAIAAFTNAILDEEIYCYPPDGFKKPGMYMRLRKALYGLVRSPVLWYRTLCATIEKMGFTQCPESPCLFTNYRHLIFFFVDDIAVLGRKDDREETLRIVRQLKEAYNMDHIGPLKWFLGLRVIRDRERRKLWICQDSYIDKIVRRYNLQNRAAPATPLGVVELKSSTGEASPQSIKTYLSKIGSVIYPATMTRPDIAHHASKLASFASNPSSQHQDAIDRVIRYLNGTKYHALQYGGVPEATVSVFEGSSDASFADLPGMKSSEGRQFELFGGSIDWKSTKQKTVGRSTTEVELRAASDAGVDLEWWKRFFHSIDLDIDHTPFLNVDNQQTVGIINKDLHALTTLLKNINVHQHWLRQEAEAGNIAVRWVPTAEMKADGLTKVLNKEKHQEFVKQLGLVDVEDLVNQDKMPMIAKNDDDSDSN